MLGTRITMNAKDLQIEYQLALDSPSVQRASRRVLWDYLRTAITQGGSMKVFQPSTFLKHEDLDGQDWVVTIKHVSMEPIKSQDGKEKDKFILHFNECKPLVLNKTNMTTLIKLFKTNESDEWVGKKITLYVKDDVEFGGELVSAVRIRAKLPL